MIEDFCLKDNIESKEMTLAEVWNCSAPEPHISDRKVGFKQD